MYTVVDSSSSSTWAPANSVLTRRRRFTSSRNIFAVLFLSAGNCRCMNSWRRGGWVARENFGISRIGRRYDYCDPQVGGRGGKVCIVNSHKSQRGANNCYGMNRQKSFPRACGFRHALCFLFLFFVFCQVALRVFLWYNCTCGILNSRWWRERLVARV